MISIDKLSLHLPGLPEDEGRRLAQLIAQDLALVSLPAGRSANLEGMNINITSAPGTTVEKLSQLIVADMLRQLERSL